MAPNGEIDRYMCTSTNSIESTMNLNDRLYLYIDGQWYDLTQWQFLHPGGSAILQYLNRKDATDVFYSLHSKQAIQKLSHLKPCSSLYIRSILPIIEPTDITLSFRQLRENLIDLGYFNRSIFWDFFSYISPYVLCLFGTFCHLYWGHNLLAILIIGFGMQQAGWVGHDYAHARGTSMRWLCRFISGFINGFSPAWWSQKHNTHHIFTNNIGIDTDIATDPIFYLFLPSKNNDAWFRAYQHWYFIPVYSLLYLSWRCQSLRYAFDTTNYLELIFMLPSYVWLYMLGWRIAICSILIGGLLVALVVTTTHQSGEMLIDSYHPFVETQLLTTCDVQCNNTFMGWLCGGMQYQLEHHLFPTMPRYNYVHVRPILRQWTKENGIEYRCESAWSIWRRNYRKLKQFAGKITNVR